MKSIKLFAVTLVSMLLFTAGIAQAALPWEVTSITPNWGDTGVSTLPTVTVVFSTAMDATTLAGANNIYLRVDGNNVNLTGTVTYDATTRTATYTPTVALQLNTVYRIYLSRNIRTFANVRINGGATYSEYTFTTTTNIVPPTVTSIDPPDTKTGVARTATIGATFSETMDPATITTASFTVSNGVTGTITLFNDAANGNRTVATFTPSAPLAYNTTYTVTIRNTVRDISGMAMVLDKTWSFTTLPLDSTPPTVTFTAPTDTQTAVATNTSITATFSEAIDPATITTGSFFLSGGGSGTVTYDSGTLTATFTPSSSLANNTTYTATITTAVTDLAVNHLAANKVWTFTTTGTFPVNNVPLTNYCQIPPFVTSGATALKPNVLLVVDNSGSMEEFAYKGTTAGCLNGFDCSYVTTSRYYGYFEPEKMYAYDTTAGGFFYVDSTKTLDKASFWSGNQLNWLTMRRVDVVRKVLVGGKTQPRSATQPNYRLIHQYTGNTDRNKSYGGKYYRSAAALNVCTTSSCAAISASYNMKVKVEDNLTGLQEGLLLQMADKINFGIMNFNDGYRYEQSQNSVRDGGNVTVDLGATGTNLLTQVENTDPSTWTPLAETLYEAIRYFKATTSAYNGGTYSGKDPVTASCMKNFVLILTDGESTQDRNLPGTGLGTTANAVPNDIGFNVKTYMDYIKTTEGWGTSRWQTDANGSNGTWYLPAVALYAHTTDLRSDKVGMQNLGIYTVFAFDDSAVGRELLKLTAKYGGFDDAAMSSTSRPTSASQWGKCDASGIIDLTHCTPNNYFEAQDGDLLQQSLKKAFDDILSKVSSGTSASIVNNRGESGANLFQAVFYPKVTKGTSELTWTGELQNLWYFLDPGISTSSIREDTDFDRQLDMRADKKVTVDYDTTKNQTVANWFTDTTGLGNFTFTATGSPDNIHALWRAGGMLHARNAATRTIKTSLSSFNAGYLNSSYPLVSSSGYGWTSFTAVNAPSLVSSMNVSDTATAEKVIDYVRGVDYLVDPNYRSRTTTISYDTNAPAPLNTSITGVWKLGDIVASTPQAQTAKQFNAFDTAYNDTSYNLFYTSKDYKARNMVYTAANDGMLHAFRVGQVSRVPFNSATPYTIAKMVNPNNSFYLGDEEWAYVPGNAIPYLKYLGDPSYNHLYYVNNTVTLVDVSINKPSDSIYTCTQEEYWNCQKKTTYVNDIPKTFTLEPDKTSWRSVLIGGMGLGGASRDFAEFCNKADGSVPNNSVQETRLDCVKSPAAGKGLSSFFALDVTTPESPRFMWEFSDAVLPAADKGLGYSMAGPAIVRVSAKEVNGTTNILRNGRWFTVFATGPSGPIEVASRQFLGRSDNKLKIYVVDMHPDMSGGWVKNHNYWVFDSGIANAFAGDLTDTVVDVDRWNSNSPSYYTDDVVYIGYTRPKSGVTPAAWTDGGILRLLTNNSINPADWRLSTLIDGVGPVTSAPTRLQDRKNGALWTYFGTGRYFYKNAAGVDDPSNQQYLIGVKDPCYDKVLNTMKSSCISSAPLTLSLSDLEDQSTTISQTLGTTKSGWMIKLDLPGTYALGAQMQTAAYNAERVVTNTTAAFNGVLFFTSFKPTDDVCGFGGSTSVWMVDYANGGEPPPQTMKGKLLIQLSGGEFVSIDVSSATKANGDASQQTRGDRRTRADLAGHGIAGSRGGSLQSPLKPLRKILHIMEK